MCLSKMLIGLTVDRRTGSLVPDMGKFDAEDVARLLNEAGDAKFPDRFKPRKAFAEGGTWFILAESESEFGFVEENIFVFNRSPPTVVRLPKLQWYHTSSLFTFAPTFKAFV
ncbi:hypothetical protein R1sor_006007 [Riccia sorocarpa]|uniref:Uncharacterized protein n=1 Tax=Riccia sorocarpa TaxID=122646 RepID=A0ABD3HN89_9MARC